MFRSFDSINAEPDWHGVGYAQARTPPKAMR